MIEGEPVIERRCFDKQLLCGLGQVFRGEDQPVGAFRLSTVVVCEVHKDVGQ